MLCHDSLICLQIASSPAFLCLLFFTDDSSLCNSTCRKISSTFCGKDIHVSFRLIVSTLTEGTKPAFYRQHPDDVLLMRFLLPPNVSILSASLAVKCNASLIRQQPVLIQLLCGPSWTSRLFKKHNFPCY